MTDRQEADMRRFELDLAWKQLTCPHDEITIPPWAIPIDGYITGFCKKCSSYTFDKIETLPPQN